jgi:carboxymethylenebutenolidase
MHDTNVSGAIRCSLLPVILVLMANAFAENHVDVRKGSFISLKQSDGREIRAFAAGSENATAAILVVHDYFGISTATEQAVEHLGALGYRALAIDLYDGRSATNNEQATKLMQALDRNVTDRILQAGLDYLKRPGRKIATIGFSMGGLESLNANLNDPEAVSATVIIYGFGFDKIDKARLEKLRSPVLVIAGSLDLGATDAAVHFLSVMKDAKRPYELLVYPDVDHGYAQPLFNEGKNYNKEAVHATWVLVDYFLEKSFN